MISITSNIDAVIQRFTSNVKALEGTDFSQALVVGVNAAKARMQFRIFNEGKDAQGNTFGGYAGKKRSQAPKKLKKKDFLVGTQSKFSPYELKRISKGRQVRYKDLEFTGALRKGIVVVTKDKKKVICAIVNAQLILIADGQEQQIGKIRGIGKAVIFTAAKEEMEILRNNTKAALTQLYARSISAK